jgi:hypothetical protein
MQNENISLPEYPYTNLKKKTLKKLPNDIPAKKNDAIIIKLK